MATITYHQINPNSDQFPWDLFLLADPSREMIKSYLAGSEVVLTKIEDELIGGYIISEIGPSIWELKNIAVNPQFQQQGLGRQIMADLVAQLKNQQVKELHLGTGAFGYQLQFYQRFGFRVEKIEKDYFTKNYPEPIFENGLQHLDRLWLVLKL